MRWSMGRQRWRVAARVPGQARATAGFGLVEWLSVLLVTFGIVWLLGRSDESPAPAPQLILVAGGYEYRERHAARLARESGLPVLVTGGISHDYGTRLFRTAQVPSNQVSRDDRAHDTLENFTTSLAALRQRKVRHILLVTGSDHMPRALLVGRIVAGSRGILVTPEAVDCGEDCHPESPLKRLADAGRAVVWAITGHDLKHVLSPVQDSSPAHPASR